ncbi:MAG: beta-galactosidase [Thermoguttaceae bacterium]
MKANHPSATIVFGLSIVLSALAAAGERTDEELLPPRLSSRDIAGVYAIIQGKPFHDSVYDLKITGLSVRAYWKDIEPAPGQYDWQLFDTVVRRAADVGKRVRLSVMVGHGVPKWVGATWFRGSPDSIYDTANKDMPLPWDENLRREQKRMICAFAERYRHVPHLAFFHIAGPSSIWEELALPNNLVEQPGFSKQVIADCWREVIEEWARVRGNKRLSVSASAATPVYPDLGDYLGTLAAGDPANPLDHGLLGSDFCMQWNYLDNQFQRAVRSQSAKWLPKTAIAWQFWGSTVWPGRKTTDYEGSLRLAIEAGATYVEVYDDDLHLPEPARIAEKIDAQMKRRWDK